MPPAAWKTWRAAEDALAVKVAFRVRESRALTDQIAWTSQAIDLRLVRVQPCPARVDRLDWPGVPPRVTVVVRMPRTVDETSPTITINAIDGNNIIRHAEYVGEDGARHRPEVGRADVQVTR